MAESKFAPLGEELEINLDDVAIQPAPTEDALVVARLVQDNQILTRGALRLRLQLRRTRYAAIGFAALALLLLIVAITARA